MELQNLVCKCCTAPLDPGKAAGRTLRCEHCGTAFVLAREDEGKVVDLLRSGELLLDTCKFDEAYTAYQKAAELDKEEPEAYFGMALAAFKVQYLKDEASDPPRLQPICHEATEKRFAADRNYVRALELASAEQQKVYREKAAEIDEIRTEFCRLRARGTDYDCFLCVKVSDENGGTTQDSHEALKLYNHLKRKGYNPFYSEEEAGSRTGSDYEALILYALYTARCMLIVCFDETYLHTKWVKNEYTRFLAMIANEEKERSALTFVFHGKPVERLPGKNGKIQGIDLSKPDAYTRIDNFVKSHTSEAADGEEERRAEEVRRKFENRQRAAGSSDLRGMDAPAETVTAEALTAQGNERLEAHDLGTARARFARALELAPENAEARWGAFLCDFGVAHEEEIVCGTDALKKLQSNRNYSVALRYAEGETRERIEAFRRAMAKKANIKIGDGEARLRDLHAEARQAGEKAEAGKDAIRKAEEEVANFNLARREWEKGNKDSTVLVICGILAGVLFEVLFNLYAALPLAWQIVVSIAGGLVGMIVGGCVLAFLFFLVFAPVSSASDAKKKKKLSEKYSIPLSELTDAALKRNKKGMGKGNSAAEQRLQQAMEQEDALCGELKAVREQFIGTAEENILYHQSADALEGRRVLVGKDASGYLPKDLEEEYLAFLASEGTHEEGNG